MNSNYKLVYSEILNTWVAVAEHVSARGKKSALRLVTAAALMAGGAVGTGASLAAPPLITPPAVNQLPTGAQVAAGTVSISQTQTATAASMAIAQSSNQAIVNWQSFNVGANAKVNITQPNASSVLLNRVQSSDPSQIFGQINANGQVLLLNPNGVYFAPGSRVDVGSFTASTHSISDADFLNGQYRFNRNGASGSILNEGTITSGLGGYIALLAPEVRNQGVVLAQMGGTVALAAGESFQLQFGSNNQLTNVLVTPATIQTLVDNGQAVQAPGGLIILSAQAASGLLGGVVKNSGAISATGLVSDGGTIRLSASHKIELAPTSSISADAAPGSAGNGGRIDIIADLGNASSTTQVDGTISAKGGELGGDGGFVDTSAARLAIGENTLVSTGAPKGQPGTWLLDPYDVTIVDSGTASGTAYGIGFTAGATSVILTSSINNSLAANTNVTISTGLSTNGAASNYSQNIVGNIYLNGNISWNTAATLKLIANKDIFIGGSTDTGTITVGGNGTLTLNPGTLNYWNATSTEYINTGGQILMGMAATPTGGLNTGYWNSTTSAFSTGAATGFNGQINVSPNAALNIGDAAYTVINSRQAFEAINNTGSGYVVGSNLDFAGTTYTASPVVKMEKSFNGLGHQISNLTISQSGANQNPVGLFGYISSNNNFNNLGVTGSVTATTAGEVGSLAGYMAQSRVYNVYSTASVTATINTGSYSGYGGVGGLFGMVFNSYWSTMMTNAYATGKVTVNTNTNAYVGGLIGKNGPGGNQAINIAKSYATGNVEVNVTSTGSTYAGGLVGHYDGDGYSGQLNYSYATGNVTVTGGAGNSAGGLIGRARDVVGGLYTFNYASGAVTNSGTNASTGGLFGYIGGSSISNSFATGAVTAPISSGSVGGLVGWLGTNNNPTLSYSYASNSVSGPALSNSSGSGALVGLISTSGGSLTLTSNYYDSSKSGQSRGIGGSGNGNSPNYYAVYADATNQVSALTTGQLKTASNLPGFTFGSAGFGYAGSINGGLPVICTLSSCTSFITSVVSATYNGLSGGLWSVGTNWIGGIAPVAGSSVTEAVINSGSSVTYETTTVGSLGFDIQNAGSITFTGLSDVTLSGLISGAGSLTLAGTGRVTLSGANTYSAGTTVSAGVLQAGSATAFGTGAISVASDAALDLNGKTMTSTGALSLNGTGIASAGALTNSSGTAGKYVGALTLGSASSIGGSAGSISVPGGISGANTLTINGGTSQTATVILSGTNAPSSTTITAGTLQMGTGSTSGSLSGDVVNNGVLAFNRSDALTYAGAISGSGTVTKLGAGTTTLSGTNTYTGGTSISAGTLQMGAATGAGTGAISVSSGAALDLNGQTMTSTGGLTLNGSGISSGGALLNSSSTAASYAGLVTLGAASTMVGGTGTLALSNTGTLVGGGFALTLGGAQGGSIASIIDTTTASVTKQDAGTWTLNGANTYSGANTVSAGTIRAGNATAFGSGTISVVSGAALDLNGQAMTSIGALTLRGTGISSAGALRNSNSAGATYAGLVTLGAASSIIGETGSIALSHAGTITGATFGLTLGGAQGGSMASIIGTTSGTLTKQDAGTWLLSGANTFTGASTISAGTLAISNAAGLGTTAGGVTVANIATLDLRNVAVGAETISLNGGTLATSTGTSSLSGTVAMTANSTASLAGTQLTLSGIVSGSFGLTKTDSGTLVLSGTNTFTGTTTVSAGTLAITNAAGLGATSAGTTVASGAILDLRNVAVGAEAITLNGGNLSTSTGTSSLSGAVTLGASSALNVTGTQLTLSGVLTGNTFGLALLGTGSTVLNNTANALSTMATGSGIGALSVVNGSALTIGQVTTGGSTYSGISSTGTVAVQTRSGNLTVSQNVTSSSNSATALKLSAGSASGVATESGGDIVLLGSPTLLVGTGGTAVFYSGSASNANGLALTGALSSKANNYIEYTKSAADAPAAAFGYSALFRQSPIVIYMRVRTGQSSTYGTADRTLTYCYSVGSGSCQPTNYAGIPTEDQSFSLANSAVSSLINVSGGVSGSLLLSGNAFVASGFATSTDTGSYMMTLKPTLTLAGYVFKAGGAVAYAITPKPVTITNTARSTTYDGLSTYANLANGTAFTVSGLVGQDAVRTVTETASGSGVVAGNVANAGSFTVMPSAAVLSTGKASNYSFSYADALVTVAKAPLTIIANDDARFVGQTDTAGYSGVGYSGFVANQTSSALGGTLSIARSNTSNAAGTYVLNATGQSSSNYSLSYVAGSYTIVPADQLLVRLASASTTYGSSASYVKSAVSYLSSTSNSVVDLTTQASIAGSAFTLNDGASGSTAFTLGALAPVLSSSGNTAAGSYQVGATSISNTSANYSNKVTVVGTLEVGKKSLTAAVTSGLSKTYDGTLSMVNPGFGLTGLAGVDKVAVTNAVGEYGSLNAGTSLAYTVTGMSLGGTDAGNYQLAGGTSISGSNGAITPAPLRIIANNDSKSYDALAYIGGAGVSYSGLVNDESSSVLGGTLAYGGSSQGVTNAGTYSITPSGLTSSNYAVTFGNGALYINPADVSVSATNVTLTGTVGKPYDSNMVATLVPSNFVISGWQGDDGAFITQTAGSYDNANAGTGKLVSVDLTNQYTATGVTLLANYNLPTAVSGYVGVISPRPVTVSNASRNTTYDGVTSYASLTSGTTASATAATTAPSGTGLVGADALASVTQTSSGYTGAASGVAQGGSFAVTPSAAVLSTGNVGNYSFSYGDSTHTVDKANATVTANSATLTYNGVNQTVAGFTASGLVGGELAAVLTGVNASRTEKNAGTYATTASGTDGNYNLNFVTGSMIIDKANATVTANSGTLTYNGVNQTVTGFTASGLVGGELETVLTGVNASRTEKNAGTYTTTASGTDGNYNLAFVAGSMLINKAPLNLTISKTYDAAASFSNTNPYTLTGMVNSESAPTITAGAAATASANANASSYTSFSSNTLALSDANYMLTGGTVAATINRKPVSVTNTARSTTYDGVNTYAALATGTAFSVGAMVGSDAVGLTVTQTASLSGKAQAGSFTSTPSAAVLSTGSLSNYAFTYVPSTHTVDKASLAVSATPSLSGNVYRVSAFTGSYTTTAVNGETFTVTGLATGTDAGTYSSVLNVSGSALVNYNAPVLSNADLVISPKPVSVTNTARSTTYDGVSSYATLATGTAFSVGTMVGSDALTSVTQTASASGTAQAGSFTVTPSAAVLSTGNAGNYSFTYGDSTHTVDKASLAVSATPSLSGNVYRGSAFTGSYTTTAVNGETFTVTGLATGTDAGTYSSVLNLSGSALVNYNAPVLSNANLVISPRSVTVSNTSRNTTYTGVASYAGLASGTTASATSAATADSGTGLVGLDALASVTQTSSGYSGVASGVAQAGSFTVTPSAAVLSTGSLSNYAFTYVPSAHTVDKASATVTANSGTLTYNGANQTIFGLTASGLVGGETSAVLSAVSASRTEKNAGTYATTASGTDGNYNLTFVDGSMLINKAVLTATGNSSAVTYNGANQSVSGFTVAGLQSSDTVADLSSVVAAGATAKNAGSYANTVTAGTETNYTVTPVAGSLDIAKANATVTANSASVTYNGANQTASGFTATGLVGGETAAVLTGVSAYRTAKNAGSYAVAASGTDGNYNLSFVAGSLDIAKAALTATGNSSAVTYNGANQSVGGFTVAGLQGSDTVADLSSVVAAGATAKNAGSYANTVTAGTETNYTVSTVPGSLDIAKANATVTANSASVTYNGGNQSVNGFTATGLVGGETSAVLSGVTAPGATGKNAGTYALTASGSDGNYKLSFVDGAMLINPAPLVITAVTNTKSFDGNVQAQAVPVVSGLKGPDAVINLSEAYADANPGTGKTLSVQTGYQIVDGNNGNNYVVSLVPSQAGEIRALPVAVLAPALAVAPTGNSAPPTLTVLAASSAGASSAGSGSASSAGAGSAGGGSSAGVSVSTISTPSQQVTGLVAVLVPSGTATAGSGLVIALPEQVVAPAATGAAVQVTLPNGEPLPSWVRYDAATQTLVTSAVPAGAFPLSVVVTVGGQSTVVQISESQSNP